MTKIHPAIKSVSSTDHVTTEITLNNHGIGHTSHSRAGRASVQCTCGAVLGETRREAFPIGGYIYTATTEDGRKLNSSNSMSIILEQFKKLFPEHAGV